MKYKIGDKVRIIKFPNQDCIGYICEVIEILNYSSSYEYCCKVKCITVPNWECLMLPNEIEKIPIKGQQLLFSFMD